MSQTSKFPTAKGGSNPTQDLRRELEDLKRRLQAYESASHYRISQDVFSAVFYQSSQLAAILALDGTVVDVNHAWLNLADATAENVVGRRLWQVNWWVNSSVDGIALREAILRAGRGEMTQQGTHIRQILQLCKAGDRFAVLDLTIKPIHNHAGQIMAVLVEGRNGSHYSSQHPSQYGSQHNSQHSSQHNSQRSQSQATVQTVKNSIVNDRIVNRSTANNPTVHPAVQKPRDWTTDQNIFKQQHCYAALAQVSPVGIFCADRYGTCSYVNDRLCQISGLSPEDAVGMAWIQAIYPADQDMVRDAWRQSVQDCQPFRVEFRYQRSNGAIVWVVGQVIAETAESGETIGYVGSVIDITDRKQAELTLQESEERFRATFEQAAVGVSHVGLDGRWLRVNEKLCEIVGYSRDELLKRTFQSITHPDDLDANLEKIDELLRGDCQTYCMEKRYLCKDGSSTWVNITVSLMRERSANGNGAGGDGNPDYMIVVVEDINDRKQAAIAMQERAAELSQLNTILSRTTALLEERNRELDQFAYIASHDLKAPLRAIANLSEWIEEDLNGTLPEENQQQLQLLRSRVHRMEDLINGLLEYSRAGRTQTAIDTVLVNALLADVIDSLAPPETFKIHIQPDMPTLTTRMLMLRQVFANLIGNAIKHHDRPNGQVTVSAYDRGTYYEFVVSDDGPGIAPENHNKVFGIFQTLTARDVKESTGIGLSIVKKIVETEGGKITLESEVGKGATFRFTWLKQPK